MTYNLNLTADYCQHWTLSNALRELIANTIDEQGSIHHNSDTGTLTLETPKVLPIEAFLMGYSVKSQNAIGQYGEGLKVAVLILMREGITFSIRAGAHQYLFTFETPPGIGVKTLHVTMTEVADVVHADKTIIVVEGVSAARLAEIYIEAPIDTLLPNSKGFYCHGLLVEPDFMLRNGTITYGINTSHAVNLNRDRTYFSNKRVIVPILEQTLDPAFFADDNFNTSMLLSSIYPEFSNEYAQKVAKARVAKKMGIDIESLKDKRVLFATDTGQEFIKRKKYFVAPYWYAGTMMLTETDKQALREMLINFDEPVDIDYERTDSVGHDRSEKRLHQILEELETTEIAVFPIVGMLLSFIALNDRQRATIVKAIEDRFLEEEDNSFIEEDFDGFIGEDN